MRLFIASLVVMVVFAAHDLYAALPDIETAVKNKDYAHAKEMALEIIKITNDPSQRAEARYYFGLAQLHLMQYTAARNAFQIVMEANPAQDIYDKAALGITEEYYITGYYQESLDTVEKLLKHSPQSSYLSLIYLKIAGASLKLAQWEKANEYLNKVINEFPQSLEAPIAKQLLEEKQYFSVQVGAFLDKDRAASLVKSLNAGGHDGYIVAITAGDGEKFYRVRVGKVDSLKKAEDLEKDITKLGYPALIYP